MKRKVINWMGLAGLLSFLSYTAAVVFAPMAYPGYNWMAQAVSDLSAETAPSRTLWNQLSAFHGAGSMVCMACVCVYVSEKKPGTRLFRTGIYLFGIMELISTVGYKMFPLADSGKEIGSFQEVMHLAVTAAVVPLSVISLAILIIAGFRKREVRGIGILAAAAFAMMLIGSIGFRAVPPEYFGVLERFSVFAAVGFVAVLGWYLFCGFRESHKAAG